jgi:enoyl-CoA hydratase/carnithine racemase
LAEAPQISVAVASGYALAGGGALIASCDYAVCSEDAKFGYPVLKVGIVPTPGMPFLRSEMRERDFRSLIFGGEMWDGRRAYEAGLVNAVLATPEEAMGEAERFIGLLLAASPAAVAETKRFSNALTRANLRAEMQQALESYKSIRRGPQATEGLRAFAEKRTAVWENA